MSVTMEEYIDSIKLTADQEAILEVVKGAAPSKIYLINTSQWIGVTTVCRYVNWKYDADVLISGKMHEAYYKKGTTIGIWQRITNPTRMLIIDDFEYFLDKIERVKPFLEQYTRNNLPVILFYRWYCYCPPLPADIYDIKIDISPNTVELHHADIKKRLKEGKKINSYRYDTRYAHCACVVTSFTTYLFM